MTRAYGLPCRVCGETDPLELPGAAPPGNWSGREELVDDRPELSSLNRLAATCCSAPSSSEVHAEVGLFEAETNAATFTYASVLIPAGSASIANSSGLERRNRF
ncbi:hypothetical protein KM043_012613 [Ampulex compressa]|nr:hypothetical protein KM043_012613 [Ampulex compressa]